MRYSECSYPLHQEIEVDSNDEVIQITENLYCFIESNRNRRYLILGSERAALIDTGYSYKNPWKQIRSITQLPIMLICTHGDPDHALGVRWYSKAYIHKLDVQRILDYEKDIDTKIRNLNYYHKDDESIEKVKQLFLNEEIKEEQFITIEDQDILDLGNKELQVIHLPSHTFGSVAILDKSSRDLFIGDSASYDDLWLFCLGTRVPPFMEIKQSYLNLRKYEDDYDRIWGTHGKQPIHKEMIPEIIETIDDIYVNHDNEEINPSRFIARVVNGSTVYNHYHKSVKLVYTKEQLEEYLNSKNSNY